MQVQPVFRKCVGDLCCPADRALAEKVCNHTLLALIYMKISGHTAFVQGSRSAVGNDGKESKETKETATAKRLDALHRRQAEFVLANCRLPEESSALRHKLNRMVAPGDCALGKNCPSLGTSKYSNGKSRGQHSCEHSFPTEFHVAFDRCPNLECGHSFCFVLSVSRFFRWGIFASIRANHRRGAVYFKIHSFAYLCARSTMSALRDDVLSKSH